MSEPPSPEHQRLVELVQRLRRLGDEIVAELPLTLTKRNCAVTMLDAAATIIDHHLDGIEPNV